MAGLSRKTALVIGSILALTLLFNSVVYACSKLGVTGMVKAMPGSTMPTTSGESEKSVERGPCAQHKQDICKSIRDRMISSQPSLFKERDDRPPAPQLFLLSLVIENPSQLAFLALTVRRKIAFNSVFKLPLPLSLSVLRI